MDKKHNLIEVSAKSLLDWSKLELKMPNLDNLALRRYFLGFDWFQDKTLKYESVVEMPWGVYLQPLGEYGIDFEWSHPLIPDTRFGQTQLWFSSIENPAGPEYAVQFELLDARGLELVRPSSSGNIEYRNSPDYTSVQDVVECSPTTNWDRLELSASLSRRFSYTGDHKKNIQTEKLQYRGFETGSCFVPGRTIDIQTFGISALGGWLDVDAEWTPKPGCALKAWTDHASLGRDHYVKYERAGFLYPFGIPAELVILSEREFIRDDQNHFVAPLIKQAFIQIPQPNALSIEHGESPFTELSITTTRTPPLDIPVYLDESTNEKLSGNLIDYAMCDYFLPKVGGEPFEFEHRGIDHAGNPIMSRMSMYFVSNKATSSNGLIPEPGTLESLTHHHVRLIRQTPRSPCSVGSPSNKLLDCYNFDPAGAGLRSLDIAWQQRPFRFAKYQRSSIALASSAYEGDTTNDVEWIEWVRAGLPDVGGDGIAQQPFLPRARTLKIALPSMRQFSGQMTYMLATYRDVRDKDNCRMDPDPTIPSEEYLGNVLRINSPNNSLGAYLHILPIKPIRADNLILYPINPTIDSVEELIRSIYFGDSMGSSPHPVPAELFTNLRNEIQFGFNATSEALGGIATPDSTVGLLTRLRGPLGDAAADPRRWKEATTSDPFAVLSSRIDYIHYRLKNRSDALLQPFDMPDADNKFPPCETFVQLYPDITNPTVTSGAKAHPTQLVGSSGLADITSLFGVQAEILPGIRLSRVLKLLSLGALDSSTSEEQTGPTWSYAVSGMEKILALFGQGEDQVSPFEVQSLADNASTIMEPSEQLKYGVEARLDWETRAISALDLGFMHFVPGHDASFSVHASASMALGDSKPTLYADAKLAPFKIIALQCLVVEFKQVHFAVRKDGSQEFTPNIGEVGFTGALSFINNLKNIFKGLEDRFGLVLSVTPQQVAVSQKIMIPPTDGAQPAGTLQVGPATICNLNFNWGVRIPLINRGAMSVAFGLATREDPLTIFVPPWYGGKAHALMEVTTRGVRLFEVSMEYGALVLVKYSIAQGEVSVMGGIFFQVAKDADIDTFMMSAYVKIAGQLDVARIIRFSGLIFVAMTYEKGSVEGAKISGQSTVTVSMKFGFVRISYSFTARHEEHRSDGSHPNNMGLESVDGNNLIVNEEEDMTKTKTCIPSYDSADEFDEYPFRLPEVRAGWGAFVHAYAS